jgi:hypothetical protein
MPEQIEETRETPRRDMLVVWNPTKTGSKILHVDYLAILYPGDLRVQSVIAPSESGVLNIYLITLKQLMDGKWVMIKHPPLSNDKGKNRQFSWSFLSPVA